MSGPDPGSAAERPSFDGLLYRLSAVLAHCPVDAIDSALDELVGQVAGSFDVDHGALARPSPDGGPLRIAHRWARPGCAPLPPFDPEARLPWITARLVNGAPVCLAAPDDLPAEAVLDRAFLRQLGIRSIASLPLVVGEAPVGWLMLSTVREDRPWPPPVIDQLRRIAEILGSAVARAQADHALRRAIEFDQAVAGLAASLSRVPLDAIDAQIVRTLGAVGELLGADRGSVVQLVPAQGIVTRTHQWVRTGTPGPPVSDPEDAFPRPRGMASLPAA